MSSSLMKAVESDDADAIRSLVATNRPGCREAFTSAIIVAACNRRNVALTALLTELPECDVNTCDPDGVTALSAAASLPDDPSSCALLLDHGANPLLPDKDNTSPLHEAASSSCVRIVALLMDDVRVAMSPLPFTPTQYKPSPFSVLAFHPDYPASDRFPAARQAAQRFTRRSLFMQLCASIGNRSRSHNRPSFRPDSPRADRLAAFMFRQRVSRSAGVEVVSFIGRSVGRFL